MIVIIKDAQELNLLSMEICGSQPYVECYKRVVISLRQCADDGVGVVATQIFILKSENGRDIVV